MLRAGDGGPTGTYSLSMAPSQASVQAVSPIRPSSQALVSDHHRLDMKKLASCLCDATIGCSDGRV